MAAPEPTSPLTISEVEELIERMHKVTRLWRPLLVAGLVLVVAGFAVLAGYLEVKRQQAQATVEAQAEYIDDLNVTLESGRRIVSSALARNSENPDWNALQQLMGKADEQVTSLNQTIETPLAAASPAVASDQVAAEQATLPAAATQATASADAVAQATAPQPSLVRIFLHIQDPAQMADAEAVAAAWAGQRIGDMTIVIPRIELVKDGSNDTLRCTKVAACRNADAVLVWINASLADRSLRKLDLSRRFENDRNIRPGTYEVWFAPGPIVLKGGT